MSIQKLSTLTGAGSTIPAAGRFAAVSGGTTSTYTDSGVTYQVQTFTASGTLTVANSGVVDILVVGGGGAGGSNNGGGGGGGGAVISQTSVFLPAGTQTITVGAGGTYAKGNGSVSRALGFTAPGGGGGGSADGTVDGASAAQTGFGGSGGGASSTGGTGGAVGPSSNFGFAGGGAHTDTSTFRYGGGGGGTTAAGQSALAANNGGLGGAGTTSTITGSSVEYGKGGNGGPRGAAPTANTGNGGGGNPTGTAGAAGVVIIRTVTAGAAPSGVVASGGTQTTYTGNGTNGVNGRNYVVQRFNANGTLTVTQPGYADVLIVSGGSGGGGEYASSGAGGGITFGNVYLGSGSYSVVVGAGSTLSGATATGNPGGIGGTSYLGQYGSPLSTSYSASGPNAPLTSTITGSSVTYAQTGTAVTANTGNGGIKAGCCSAPPGALGSSGVVIVRY